MQITTIKELKKHIGQFLVYEYRFNPQIKTIWMQKLYEVTNQYTYSRLHKKNRQTEIDGLGTYGLYATEIYPRQKTYTKIPTTPIHTDAQNIIRTPTYEEMKLYQKIWRRYRILNDTTILNTK